MRRYSTIAAILTVVLALGPVTSSRRVAGPAQVYQPDVGNIVSGPDGSYWVTFGNIPNEVIGRFEPGGPLVRY